MIKSYEILNVGLLVCWSVGLLACRSQNGMSGFLVNVVYFYFFLSTPPLTSPSFDIVMQFPSTNTNICLHNIWKSLKILASSVHYVFLLNIRFGTLNTADFI